MYNYHDMAVESCPRAYGPLVYLQYDIRVSAHGDFPYQSMSYYYYYLYRV